MGSNHGKSASNVSIQYLERNKSSYEPGEYVEGFVEFNNDNKLEYQLKTLKIQFIGELVHTICQRKGSATTVTTKEEPFFLEELVLHSKNDEKKLILKQSNNQWKFSFLIPNFLSSSFPQNQFQGPFIHYFLRICCFTDQFTHEFTKKFPIVIYRRELKIDPIPFQMTTQNRKDVELNVNLENNLAVIGQDFPIKIHICNPKHLKIDGISMKLVQFRKLGPVKTERTVITKEQLKHLDEFKNENYEVNCRIHIPHLTIPSCSYKLPIKPYEWSIFVHYELSVKLRVSGLNTNITLPAPLVVSKQTEKTIDQKNEPSLTYQSFILNMDESESTS